MFSKIITLGAFFALSAAVPSTQTSNISLRSTNSYTVSGNAVSFLQAWGYCSNQNKAFVSLPTQAQNDALASSLSSYPSASFWIGGMYLQHGALQSWYWVDGSEEFSYKNWKTSVTIPTTSTINYCILYNYNSVSKTGVWTADNCSNNHYFVCQNV